MTKRFSFCVGPEVFFKAFPFCVYLFTSFLKIELNCIAKCVLPIDVFIAILREKIQIPISHSCLWLTLNDSGPGGREGHRESDGNILGDGGALVVSQSGFSVPAQAHCSIASLY